MSYLEGNSQLKKNVVFVGGAAREMLIFRARLIQLLSSCGQDGFIVNPWDASELAEKMHYFIDNRDEIGRMGVNAHVKAKSLFDDSPINKKLSMLILGP